MGNKNNKSELHYKSRVRTKSLHLNPNTQISIPDMPKEDEVLRNLKEILETVILDPQQQRELHEAPIETKWFLINLHKYIVENEGNTLKKVSDSSAQGMITNLKENPSMESLVELRNWLENKATSDDIQGFVIFEGVYLLLNILEVAENCSRKTENFTKQIMILRILEYLINNHDTVMEHLLQMENAAQIIFLNFNPNNVELCSSALEIVSAFCWSSADGYNKVSAALDRYKVEKSYKHRFHPFIEALRDSKNIINVENVATFVNTLIESQEEDSDRMKTRSEFSSCGLRKVFDSIRDKIGNDKYLIDDCTYEAYQNDVRKQRERVSIHPSKTKEDEQVFEIDKGSSKATYIERDPEEFDKHLLQILNQIEVFEKSVDEFGVEEIADSMELGADSGPRRPSDDAKNLDYSDINWVFEKLRNTSMDNDTFQYLLAILQQFLIIPGDEKGKALWIKISDILSQISGVDNADGLKIKELKKAHQEGRSAQALQERIDTLESNLLERDKEIKRLTSLNNSFELEIKSLKTNMEKAESIIKTYTEVNEQLEKKINSNDEKLKKMIADRDQEFANLKKQLQEASAGAAKIGDSNTEIAKLKVQITDLEKKLNSVTEEKDKKISELQQKLAAQPSVQAPALNIGGPQAPVLNIGGPQAPVLNIGGPQAPMLNIGGPQAPVLNIGGPQAPMLNIGGPQAPMLNIGGPQAPMLNIGGPQAPMLNIGGPQAPALNIGGPQAPALNIGGPSAPALNLGGGPSAPVLNIGGPSAPSLNLGGGPSAPSLNLGGGPSAPSLSLGGGPSAPSLSLGGPVGPPALNLGGPKLGGPPALNLGGPPSLGMTLQQAAFKVKEKMKPKCAMRNLMWTVINAQNIKGTVWEKLDDNKVQLDVDFLELEFAVKKAAVPDPKAQTENKTAAAVVKKITLLPGERTKNVELILGKLKMSPTAIAESLFSIDEKVLNINNINSLVVVAPTQEDLSVVLAYDGDKELLGNSERFFLELAEVPGYLQRLKALKFIKEYQEKSEDLREKLKKSHHLFSSLPTNPKLLSILENVLAIGNYLNGTSARGGAYGFKLDALEKLGELKMQSNPKKTLLCYVIETVERKQGMELVDINEKYEDYEICAKNPLSQLTSDFNELRLGAKSVSQAMEKQTDHPKDRVREYFAESDKKVEKVVAELEALVKSTDEAYTYVCSFLCESIKDTPSDKFCEKMLRFWGLCKTAKQLILKEKEAEKKESEKKEKKSVNIIDPTGKPANLMSNLGGIKMGNPEEIVEAMRNRRISKKIVVKNEPVVAGGIALPKLGPRDQLLPPGAKPSERQSSSNLAYLSNVLIQGAIKKENEVKK